MSLLLDALKRAELAKKQQSDQGLTSADEAFETEESNASPSLELVDDSTANNIEATTPNQANQPSRDIEATDNESTELDIPDELTPKPDLRVDVTSQPTSSDVDDDGLSDFVPNTAQDCVAPKIASVLPNMSFIKERASSTSTHESQHLTLQQNEPVEVDNSERHASENTPAVHDIETPQRETRSDGVGDLSESVVSDKAQVAYQPKSKKSDLRFIGAGIVILILFGAGGTLYFIDALEQISSDSNLSRLAPTMTVADDLRTLNNNTTTLVQNETETTKSPTVVNIKPVSTKLAAAIKTVVKPISKKKVVRRRQKTSAVASTPVKLIDNVGAKQTTALNIVRKNRVDPLQVILGKAYGAYVVSNYEKANRLYREALGIKANNRDALLGLAIIAHRSNQANQARLYYKKILSLNPKDSQAAAGLIALVQGSNATESESRIKILLENEPQAAHLHYTLGNQYVNQARWADAQKAFFQAYSADPGNADYAMNLAVSLDHIKQPKAAVQYYQLALELARGKNVSFNVLDVAARIKTIKAGAQ